MEGAQPFRPAFPQDAGSRKKNGHHRPEYVNLKTTTSDFIF